MENPAGHRPHRVQPVALPLLVEEQVPQVDQVTHGADELLRARQPHVAHAQVRESLPQVLAHAPAEHRFVPGGVPHPEVPQLREPGQVIQVPLPVQPAPVHEHDGGERREEPDEPPPLFAPQVPHRHPGELAVAQRVPEAVGVAAQVGQNHRVVPPQGAVVDEPPEAAAAAADRVLLLRAQEAEHVHPHLRGQLLHLWPSWGHRGPGSSGSSHRLGGGGSHWAEPERVDQLIT